MRCSRRRGLAPTPGLPPHRMHAADSPRIPGYEVEALLGRGGMGLVYRARHLRLNRLVALKMLLAGSYAGPHERARFQREAEAVAGLRHANIVQVYDVGDHDGCPYFTMELLEGGSLAQALAGTPQPARQAAALLATLAEAVQAAHQAGIVHRDLKPANILLTAEARPQGRRFRAGAALRRGAGSHAERRPDRDPQLHGPRAGVREGRHDRARRGRLRARRRPLRDAHRKAAVPGGDGGRDGAAGAQRRAGAPLAPEPESAARPRDDLPEVPVQGTGASLRQRRGAGR